MKIINTEPMVIKSWCNEPEEGAINQAKNLANLPFLAGPVCLMPDTHQGYGMPIGGVLATKKVIIPNAVGVDIGCGMLAVNTRIKIDTITNQQLIEICELIKIVVPIGLEWHKEDQAKITTIIGEKNLDLPVVRMEKNKLPKQLGTLGGGNHFIELQKDEDGNLWCMLHTGSRNYGKKVCNYYNNIAKDLNKSYFSSIPSTFDLAFLPIDSKEGNSYLKEMKLACEFAKQNRYAIFNSIISILRTMFEVNFANPIEICHNYAEIYNINGNQMIIHRKGAISAKKGEIGIIPGSSGTASYITVGLGNKDSFYSCSHGAGRRMGRAQAQKNLSLETEQEILNSKGILHSLNSIASLDEATGAYKDIDIVMEEQKDLVQILLKLSTIAVIKG